ncbi:TPA_asm: RNA-directed RNA polymerase [ssRNA phage SRR6255733_5]|uniref:RNA-directed RNA polymerase n=1 Tax=ssRNA phage SRR6255733_5 TaxID=2786501 RepID=A0A8S5L5B8_9VIRU|nr:RNA-directed RNA polymerase [ssRNA phage SRR6255733_5]DAD52557.1 TPA_asm: RNA-directed RNA polymerase [ssRNA phage SRR6255733_5]
MKYCPCSLVVDLIKELSDQLSLCADRDLTYVRSRFEHEGLSFLTITLPSFSSGLEAAIERGVAYASDFPAFAVKGGWCLPKFLSGFTKHMFDKEGALIDIFDPDYVFALRQICNLWKKALLPCSDAKVKAAFDQYVSTDAALSDYSHICNDPGIIVRQISEVLINDIFRDFNIRDIRCKHGPGATAEKLTRNSRQLITQWPIRAEPFFPSSWHTIPNIGHINQLQKVKLLSESDETPVRVVSVPKTLKTPRIIAVEPSHMQFMQQGMLSILVRKFESHPLTRNSLRFSDQSHNREGARRSSIDMHNATLDMSEASDRVSNDLVQSIFGDSLVGKCLQACRSKSAIVPDGTLVKLQKFASMGSATCFPVEAFVFYVLIQSAVHRIYRTFPTANSIRRYSKSISVYGDDIIIPVAWQEQVVKELESFGMKVNRNKSFSNSQFRESCGGDYYKGYSVKPVYLRVDPSDLNGPTSISTLISLSESSNQFYDLGLWKFTRRLREIVQSKVGLKIPLRSYEATGVYFKSCTFSTYGRYNRKLHRFETKTLVPVSINRFDDISHDFVGALTMSLRNIGNDNPVDLISSVRPYSLRHKSRWIR